MADNEKEPTLDEVPSYFEMLSERDKAGYLELKSDLSKRFNKRHRGHRIETFSAILETIRNYIKSGTDQDWLRSLVCGIVWMGNNIAINTRKLCCLIYKCKSLINGSLQRMGYITNQSHSESWKMFLSKIPLLEGNYGELRQWTIRSKNDPIPATVVLTPIIPVQIPYTIQPPIFLTPTNSFTSYPHYDMRQLLTTNHQIQLLPSSVQNEVKVSPISSQNYSNTILNANTNQFKK